MLISLHTVQWAAEECTRQKSGEMSVAWMIEGWLYAHRRRNQTIILRDVLALGSIVEPRTNRRGLRQVSVRVGSDIMLDWALVPAALDQLLNETRILQPDEWFRRYEEIHPFRDGNGRTGNILWNWLRGSLETADTPPDFWSAPSTPVRVRA